MKLLLTQDSEESSGGHVMFAKFSIQQGVTGHLMDDTESQWHQLVSPLVGSSRTPDNMPSKSVCSTRDYLPATVSYDPRTEHRLRNNDGKLAKSVQ